MIKLRMPYQKEIAAMNSFLSFMNRGSPDIYRDATIKL